MTDLFHWTALLLTGGLLIALLEIFGTEQPRVRIVVSAVCAFLTVRYAWWRIFYTMPHQQNFAQQLWSFAFLGAEMCTVGSSLLIYFFMSRTLSRSHAADAGAASPLVSAPTDTLIATYNESRDILERTIVGALALDHTDHRVWVLDDGDRGWVRELAEELGAHYVSRHKGKHAKAGNINHGLEVILATGRRPQFILLLDADFVPHSYLLTRVLGLFDDTGVGIVQTPQHFFNADPVQSNLLCSAVWPDEQRFFFNVLMPSKDAWGAAFCCGTSAVIRVEALLASGGMATQTVTEDMLTSFQIAEFGYRTIFLNERLSLGLAPESLVEFIAQRSRWCLGAVQQLFTPWSFYGSARMNAINRLAFLDSVLYWVSGAAFKIMLISAPAIYWLTGTATMHATATDLLQWLGPMFVANIIYMRYYAGNRILPIVTDVTQLLTAFVIARTIATAIVRPFGRPFKVTAKGLSTSTVTIQWRLIVPYAVIAGCTIVGTVTHIQRFSHAHGAQGYSFNILWSLINVATLTLAAMACVEVPHRRRDERFSTSEAATIELTSLQADSVDAGGVSQRIDCTLDNISLGGAAISRVGGWSEMIGPACLCIHSHADNKTLKLPFTVVNRNVDRLTLQFSSEPWVRHALIRKLFTGDYHREITRINAAAVFSQVGRNLIS